MTVLNVENDGLVNILIVLARASTRLGPVPRSELIAYCAPGVEEPQKRLNSTLSRWITYGLFKEEGDTVSLNKQIALPKDPRLVEVALPRAMRRIIFDEQNNTNFWDSKDARCSDLTRGLAWLLAQNIYDIDLGSDALQRREGSQFEEKDKDKRIFQHEYRVDPLRQWARFLGFMWGNQDAIIDPTEALLQDLDLVFADSTELPASEFVDRIAEVNPVLDRGAYREQVEEVLSQSVWQKPSRPELLSTSLSRGLWRLRHMRVLALEPKSDSGDIRVLQRSGGRDWLSFAHVRRERRDA